MKINKSLIAKFSFFAIVLLLTLSSCRSNYNSRSKWNRTPASTGRSRCGCLMEKPNETVIFYEVIENNS